MRERPRDLVGARNAAARDAVRRHADQLPPLEHDAAAVSRVMAAHHVDERRLARAVRADEPKNFTIPDF